MSTQLKRTGFKRKSLDEIRLRRRRTISRKHMKSSIPYADTKWRKAVLKRDENTCQRCHVQGVILHAHHIAMRSRRPDLKHELSNGITLCGDCHSWVHDNSLEATRLGFLSDETYEVGKAA